MHETKHGMQKIHKCIVLLKMIQSKNVSKDKYPNIYIYKIEQIAK